MDRPNISFNSPDWGKIAEWLEQELNETYLRLASLDCNQTKTEQLRGKASLLRVMLDWPQAPAAGKPLI